MGMDEQAADHEAHEGTIYMQRQFTLEYWVDDDWYVGKLKEVPGVFSQGEKLAELEDSIKDAYALVMADEGASPHPGVKSKEIAMDVA